MGRYTQRGTQSNPWACSSAWRNRLDHLTSLQIQKNWILEIDWGKTTITNFSDRGRQREREKGERKEGEGKEGQGRKGERRGDEK